MDPLEAAGDDGALAVVLTPTYSGCPATEVIEASIVAALDGDTPEGRLRTVLFVTDGQAHNEQELVAAVANRRGRGAVGEMAGASTAASGAPATYSTG